MIIFKILKTSVSVTSLSDAGFNELKKAMLLILGCAIQCEQKEDFIDKIKGLELTVQHEIVESIKQVHASGGGVGLGWVVRFFDSYPGLCHTV